MAEHDPCKVCTELSKEFQGYLEELAAGDGIDGQNRMISNMSALVGRMYKEGAEAGLSDAGEKCKTCDCVNIYDKEFMADAFGMMYEMKVVPDSFDPGYCEKCREYNAAMSDALDKLMATGDMLPLAPVMGDFYHKMLLDVSFMEPETVKECLAVCQERCSVNYSIYDMERLLNEQKRFMGATAHTEDMNPWEREKFASEIAGLAESMIKAVAPDMEISDILKKSRKTNGNPEDTSD